MAADYVFDRFLRDGTDTGAEDVSEGRNSSRHSADQLAPALDPRSRASIARAMDVYADLFQDVFAAFARDVTDEVALVVSGRAPTTVRIMGRPGIDAGANVWIHNISGVPAPAFQLRVSDLTSAAGGLLSAGRFDIEPAAFPASAERCRSAWLSVPIPADLDLGVYHGHVLAEGVGDASITVKLIVR